MCGEALIARARASPHPAGRCQQDRSHPLETCISGDAPPELDTIAAGHQVVEQRNIVGRAGGEPCLKRRERSLRAFDAGREHTELPDELIRDLVLMKLQAVGLRGAAQLMPAELSGGMARRVALARAIALDPLLVLYDEPFAGLDPISLGVVGQLIRRLNDALSITSIVVTHDVYESLKIVDYLYFVSEGRIVASGTAEEVHASSDPFVRQFVDGEPDGPVPFHYPAPTYREELFARAG